MRAIASEFEVRLSGVGGQGLVLAGAMLAEALALEGMNVARSQSYEPTSRGGLSRADLVVSEGEVDYPLVTSLGTLLILDPVAADASTALLEAEACVLVDGGAVRTPPRGPFAVHALPLREVALGLGSARVANMVGLGALLELAPLCALDSLEAALRQGTPAGFLDLNLEALRAGARLAREAGSRSREARSA